KEIMPEYYFYKTPCKSPVLTRRTRAGSKKRKPKRTPRPRGQKTSHQPLRPPLGAGGPPTPRGRRYRAFRPFERKGRSALGCARRRPRPRGPARRGRHGRQRPRPFQGVLGITNLVLELANV